MFNSSTLFNQGLLLCIYSHSVDSICHTYRCCMYLIFSQESTKKRTFLVVSLILFWLCFCFLSFCWEWTDSWYYSNAWRPFRAWKEWGTDADASTDMEVLRFVTSTQFGSQEPLDPPDAIVCTFVPHWQKHCHLLYILKSGLLKSGLPSMSWFGRFWAAILGGLDMILCQNCSVGFICLSQTEQGLLYALAALAFYHCYDNATILICRRFQYVCFNDWNPSEVDASPIVKSQPATTW